MEPTSGPVSSASTRSSMKLALWASALTAAMILAHAAISHPDGWSLRRDLAMGSGLALTCLAYVRMLRGPRQASLAVDAPPRRDAVSMTLALLSIPLLGYALWATLAR